MRHKFSEFEERPLLAGDSRAMCAHKHEEKRQSFSRETLFQVIQIQV
jgi:hypothetical protein